MSLGRAGRGWAGGEGRSRFDSAAGSCALGARCLHGPHCRQDAPLPQEAQEICEQRGQSHQAEQHASAPLTRGARAQRAQGGGRVFEASGVGARTRHMSDTCCCQRAQRQQGVATPARAFISAVDATT